MKVKTPPTEGAIRATVMRLSRPHRSGGFVIERAAILAEGGDSAAILAWISAHAGEAEAVASAAPGGGLHGHGFGGAATVPRGPSRYVLAASALETPESDAA
jgi:hypothetical protein